MWQNILRIKHDLYMREKQKTGPRAIGQQMPGIKLFKDKKTRIVTTHIHATAGQIGCKPAWHLWHCVLRRTECAKFL